MSAAMKTDPAVILLAKVIERVRSENKGAVDGWIAGLDQARLRERIAKWRKSQAELPDSDRIKELLASEDSVA